MLTLYLIPNKYQISWLPRASAYKYLAHATATKNRITCFKNVKRSTPMAIFSAKATSICVCFNITFPKKKKPIIGSTIFNILCIVQKKMNTCVNGNSPKELANTLRPVIRTSTVKTFGIIQRQAILAFFSLLGALGPSLLSQKIPYSNTLGGRIWSIHCVRDKKIKLLLDKIVNFLKYQQQ